MVFAKNICTLVRGAPGVGKSHWVRSELGKYFEMSPNVLKSKQSTLDMLDRLRGSAIPVLLDDLEQVTDLVGFRELVGPPSLGPFVVITQDAELPFKHTVHIFKPYATDVIQKMFPSAPLAVILSSNGNLNAVQNPGHVMNISTRDWINSLVLKTGTENPVNYIGHHVEEPGNISSIIHENYPDANANMCDIADSLSEAAVMENKMYQDNWHLLPYYNLLGCIIPACIINHGLTELRPGSIWNKYQNMCMRAKRISAITSRVPRANLNHEALILLKLYASRGNVEILKEYKIQGADLDVLNHLNSLKIKAKPLKLLKAQL